MTDTTHEAPERIWAQHHTCTVDASGAARLLAMDRPFRSAPEYVRADLVQAAVAAALTEAINRVNGCDRISEVQPAILALIGEGGE